MCAGPEVLPAGVKPHAGFLIGITWAQALALLSILLLSVSLRCYQLDYNLDGDEIFSVEAARGSFAHVFTVSLRDTTHPPLHNFVLFAWIRLFGSSEISVRLPSVLASVAFLLSTYWLATTVGPSFSGLLGLALCGLSPFFVYYGAQARPYSLAVCLTVLSICIMLCGLHEPSRHLALAYGIVCAALMYTQYLGILVLGFEFVFLLAFGRSARRLIWAGGASALSIVVWLALVGLDIGHESVARISWIERPRLLDFVQFFLSLGGYLDIDGSSRILLLLYVVALAPLLILARRLQSPPLALLATLATVPPALVWLVSRFGPFSVWAPRQFAGSAAVFLILVSIGVAEHRAWVRSALAVTLVVWCLFTVSTEFPSHSRPPWRHLARMLAAEPAGADVITVEGFVSEPLRYYSRRRTYDWKSYSERPDKASRLLLLCRPAHCEQKVQIARQYTLIRSVPVDWAKYEASQTNKLVWHIFERRP